MKLTIIQLTDLTHQDCIDLQKIWPTQTKLAWLEAMLSGTQFYAARFNERLLAAAKIEIKQKEGFIKDFCVREVTRRRGVGSYLLQQICRSQQGISQWQFDAEKIPVSQQQAVREFLMAADFSIEANNKYIKNQK
nr:aspartate 1-decarboxylase autocleavage activator PanM [uncultured Moellerella sp.]